MTTEIFKDELLSAEQLDLVSGGSSKQDRIAITFSGNWDMIQTTAPNVSKSSLLNTASNILAIGATTTTKLTDTSTRTGRLWVMSFQNTVIRTAAPPLTAAGRIPTT